MKDLLSQVNENLRGREVIIFYVNKQNAMHDKNYLANMVGRIREIGEDGISLSTGGVPFAGPVAAICSIRQVGDNFLIFKNPIAHQIYKNKSSGMLSEGEIERVKEGRKWYSEL